MTADSLRTVSLERLREGTYRVRNERGGELRVGDGAGEDFTPVELLLAAIAACTSVDVDVVTGRRAEPESFVALMQAHKVRDATGNRLTDLDLTLTVRFPEGEDGDAARAVLPRALQVSHDRSCTVSRTVEAGTPVRVTLG